MTKITLVFKRDVHIKRKTYYCIKDDKSNEIKFDARIVRSNIQNWYDISWGNVDDDVYDDNGDVLSTPAI